jgi:predicted flap endonuclease-1-like 5' DNA nuclease
MPPELNESITSFLEGLDPFWHFFVPVIVAAVLGCFLGALFSCMACRPKASAPDSKELELTKAALAKAEKELAALRQTSPQPAPAAASPVMSAVLAAAKPPAAPAHALGLLHSEKPADADDLTLITGLTPGLATKLRDLGVYRFEQISQWSAPAVDAVRKAIGDAALITEDKWIAQAKRLLQLKTGGKPLTALPRESLSALS